MIEDKKYSAFARFISYSPYKLRPIVDVIRNKKLNYALNWLETYRNKRVSPIKKVVLSAYANAKNLNSDSLENKDFVICEIKVDGGPIRKYHKPSAKGRAAPQKKRFCHISVVLKVVNNDSKGVNGTKG